MFTGISDPYEVPCDADFAIDTSDTSPDEAARQLIQSLMARGCVERTVATPSSG
jgi:sulfate adenylyltransferase